MVTIDTALVTAQANTTAWIVATTPIFMALLGWIVLRELLHGLQILGIFTAALGVLLVVAQGDFPTLLTGRFGTFGDTLILISAAQLGAFFCSLSKGISNTSSHADDVLCDGFWLGIHFSGVLRRLRSGGNWDIYDGMVG